MFVHRLIALVFALAVAVGAAAEERCCGAKEKAEAGPGGGEVNAVPNPVPYPVPRPWPEYNRRIRWVEDLQEAQRQAVARGRMLFVLQLVGNLRDAPT